MNLKDIDFREKFVRVTGKRKKQSILPFGEPALQALMFYLNEARADFLANCPPDGTRRTSRFPKLSGNAHHDAQRRANGR